MKPLCRKIYVYKKFTLDAKKVLNDNDLKELINSTYTNKMHLYLVVCHLKTSQLNVLDLKQICDG